MALNDFSPAITDFKFVLIKLQIIVAVNMVPGHSCKEGRIFAAIRIILGKDTVCKGEKYAGKQKEK
jgi:hypothetical protein